MAELNADVASVVGDFLTVPEASQLSFLLSPVYIRNRLKQLADYHALFCNPQQLQLMFPVVVALLPDEFPWKDLLAACMTHNLYTPMRWVLNNKFSLGPVESWARMWFKNLANEMVMNTTDQDYCAGQELIWHQCVFALVNNSKEPRKEWESLLSQLLHTSALPSWLNWLVDCARFSRCKALTSGDFNNSLLGRLLITNPDLPTSRKKQLYSLFTRPVAPEDISPLLMAALVKPDLEAVRELYLRIGAQLGEQHRCYIAEHKDAKPKLAHVSCFFRYVNEFGPQRAMMAYVQDEEQQKTAEVTALERRRRQTERAYVSSVAALEKEHEKQLRAAQRNREHALATVEQERKKRKTKSTQEFAVMAPLLGGLVLC